jgi:predicted permease
VDYYQFVDRDYLQTMQIPLVAGRGFDATDAAGTPVALVNERLARVFYGDDNPLGRRIRPCCGDDTPWLTIVGIVGDVKQGGVAEEIGTELYFHAPQTAQALGFAPRTMNVVMRTQGDPLAVTRAVRAEVAAIDPTLPIANLATMDDVLHDAVARPRFLTLLLGFFAAVALALAAIGTYGVMAYSVAQRRQEIGIRMALGARASSVLGMVLAQGLVVAGLGLGIGVIGALGLTRLLQSLLYNVSATDPAAFLAAPALLAVVAVLACLIPARRATRVDPATVLKTE